MYRQQQQVMPEMYSMHPSWHSALASEFSKQYFINLSNFIIAERYQSVPVYPPPEDVFRWTRTCRPDYVNVVIVGQDPYDKPGLAHGSAFSVLPEKSTPLSLNKIYTELVETYSKYGFKRPTHGYLGGWEQQGVLLLNTVLTVRSEDSNSHQYKGWEHFSDAVISFLNDNTSGLVFMLWGECAKKKKCLLTIIGIVY